MENGVEAYSMFHRRPWLKQTMAHQNWGDNTFIIISKNRIVTLSTIKHVNIKLSQRPKNLDNEFNRERLFEWKEKQLYKAIHELWLIGEMVLEKLHFVPEIDYGMIQIKDKIDYLLHIYKHEPTNTLIFDEDASITIKDQKLLTGL